MGRPKNEQQHVNRDTPAIDDEIECSTLRARDIGACQQHLIDLQLSGRDRWPTLTMMRRVKRRLAVR